MLVVLKMWAISLPSPTAIVLPGLKPNQPSHRMKHPVNSDVMLWPGIGFTRPSFAYLPRRGPRMATPVSAAQPPTEWTTVEPAKSHMPAEASQPPPQIQWPVIGYTNATSRNENSRKERNLIRSATAPDTI